MLSQPDQRFLISRFQAGHEISGSQNLMQKKSGKKEKDPGKDGKIIRGKKVLRRKTQISGKESVIPGIGEDKELMISKPQIAPAGRTGEKKEEHTEEKTCRSGAFLQKLLKRYHKQHTGAEQA